MNKIIICLVLWVGISAKSQTTSIHNIDANQDTTISIKKGENNPQKIYEFVEGTGEIEGDPNVLEKAARDNWKKACEDWKNEIKELNRANQVLVHNCNAPSCHGGASGTICKSTGSYKIRVQISK